jgi:hypothetical protein
MTIESPKDWLLIRKVKNLSLTRHRSLYSSYALFGQKITFPYIC